MRELLCCSSYALLANTIATTAARESLPRRERERERASERGAREIDREREREREARCGRGLENFVHCGLDP
jgi:Ni/Co efflux regulator RcnB